MTNMLCCFMYVYLLNIYIDAFYLVRQVMQQVPDELKAATGRHPRHTAQSPHELLQLHRISIYQQVHAKKLVVQNS